MLAGSEQGASPSVWGGQAGARTGCGRSGRRSGAKGTPHRSKVAKAGGRPRARVRRRALRGCAPPSRSQAAPAPPLPLPPAQGSVLTAEGQLAPGRRDAIVHWDRRKCEQLIVRFQGLGGFRRRVDYEGWMCSTCLRMRCVKVVLAVALCLLALQAYLLGLQVRCTTVWVCVRDCERLYMWPRPAHTAPEASSGKTKFAVSRI